LWLGCGAANQPPPASPEVARESERPAAPPDTLAVTGIRGTLSQQEIQSVLEPKLPKLLRCVQQRRGVLEPLAGEITFAFHVATNGAVVSVNLTHSTLGDRDTERCMLQIVEAARFPPPHGGEADFSWPLQVPDDPDVRPAVELAGDTVRASLGSQLSELSARCGGGQVIATAYVDPDGAVLAAGVAAPDIANPAQFDCISEGVRALRLPSPGSYLGKVSFTIP
jgi:hypothetical protein